ncbi:MAG: Mov34/MPN/PAD-1 family protein [Candidatus Lokiarchaeota archaeon]|nr:Mov34/MPN/PAD-1 family protein [Candidatus Harpocratesius repetitus]
MIEVEIEEKLYNRFFRDVKYENYKKERCGILVGKKINNELYRITDIIEDENPISQSPFGVFRSTEHIYPELIESIKRNPDTDYLGEWHTHPHGPDSASFIDKLSIKTMIKNPIYGNINWVILLIISKKTENIIYFFQHRRYIIGKLSIL